MKPICPCNPLAVFGNVTYVFSAISCYKLFINLVTHPLPATKSVKEIFKFLGIYKAQHISIVRVMVQQSFRNL